MLVAICQVRMTSAMLLLLNAQERSENRLGSILSSTDVPMEMGVPWSRATRYPMIESFTPTGTGLVRTSKESVDGRATMGGQRRLSTENCLMVRSPWLILLRSHTIRRKAELMVAFLRHSSFDV
uniref:Uncharacterized protein n=1 Tax=Arundo donax TaxID=35708 RepID=A0A0A9D7I8_ARUDO